MTRAEYFQFLHNEYLPLIIEYKTNLVDLYESVKKNPESFDKIGNSTNDNNPFFIDGKWVLKNGLEKYIIVLQDFHIAFGDLMACEIKKYNFTDDCIKDAIGTFNKKYNYVLEFIHYFENYLSNSKCDIDIENLICTTTKFIDCQKKNKTSCGIDT